MTYKTRKSQNYDLVSWITDKDKRATLAWICTLIGGIFVVGYYLFLDTSFTPTISLAQATLLLLQAFLIGTLIIIYCLIAMFAPVFAFRLCGIDTDFLIEENDNNIVKLLAHRSILAQLFVVSTFFTFTAHPKDSNTQDNVFWGIATLLSIMCGIFLFFQQRVPSLRISENWKYYLWSIIVLGLFGFLSFYFVWFLQISSSKEQRADDWNVILIWLMLVLYSGYLGASKRTQFLPASLLAFVFFWLALSLLNVTNLPFNAVAYAIGIAERNPVTLIFPKESCEAVSRATSPNIQLECIGKNSGVLTDVKLLNSLGERWLIRIGNSSENIIFDGKGVVIKKHSKKEQKSALKSK